MRKLLFVFLGLAVLGTTPALAADGPACVRRNDIRDWSSPERKLLILENYAHSKIKLKLTGNCSGFGVYDSFQITGPLEGAATCISKGDYVRTKWAGEPGLCTIVGLEPYDGPTHPANGRHTSY
jgi:hypothetical protein